VQVGMSIEGGILPWSISPSWMHKHGGWLHVGLQETAPAANAAGLLATAMCIMVGQSGCGGSGWAPVAVAVAVADSHSVADPGGTVLEHGAHPAQVTHVTDAHTLWQGACPAPWPVECNPPVLAAADG
jgi:hypothetical protein